jgi:hypothetical protein
MKTKFAKVIQSSYWLENIHLEFIHNQASVLPAVQYLLVGENGTIYDMESILLSHFLASLKTACLTSSSGC